MYGHRPLNPMRSVFLTCSASLAILASTPQIGFAAPEPTKAFATATTAAEAARLKEQGDKLMSEKRYEDALRSYEDAEKMAPSAALLFNRGRALQFLARYPEALVLIERFSQEADADTKAKVPGLSELITDLQGRVATINVRCTQGRVLFRGRTLGQAPLAGDVRVPAGEGEIEVIADGYFPWKQAVTLAAKTRTEINVRLVSRERYGILNVQSSVEGTSILVNRKASGKAPAELQLEAGTHQIRGERDSYEALDRSVVVVAGERKDLLLKLEKTTPVYGRWWFWTGLAVVVATAAIVTTVVALNTEKSVPTGEGFSPSNIPYRSLVPRF
jgi:PEGA domain